jgi:hypothetical protein
MTRCSPPQKKSDDQAFPLIAHFRLPELGLQGARIDPHNWLLRNIGLGNYATHGARRPEGDVFSVYLRRFPDLLAFIDAHPKLELADDVASDTYTSPYKIGKLNT